MPVDIALVLGFVAAASVIVLSPGPDTLLIIRYALRGGTKIGLATLAGIQVGLIGHTALAVAGLSLLVISSPLLFRAVAVAGALYLFFLAIQAVRSGVISLDVDLAPGSKRRLGPWKATRDAAMTNLLNPKVILLFIALMPQFVNTGAGQIWLQLAVLAVVLIIVNLAWQLPLALAAVAMRGWLAAPATQKAINWITFVVFTGFAILMLYEHLVARGG